jgi:hypothetical protein
MITSRPVASWTWGREGEVADCVAESVDAHMGLWSLLHGHRLLVGETDFHMSVRKWGVEEDFLFRGWLRFDATQTRAVARESLLREVRARLASGDIGIIATHMFADGVRLGADGGEREAGMFRLGATVSSDYVSLHLVTYSDAWLTHDLRGRKQPETFSSNQPRLAAALEEIAQWVGDETDPGDPTVFAIPTETGADALVEGDGSVRDLWASFEETE